MNEVARGLKTLLGEKVVYFNIQNITLYYFYNCILKELKSFSN